VGAARQQLPNLLALFRSTESATLSADLFHSKIADIARVAADSTSATKHIAELRRPKAELEPMLAGPITEVAPLVEAVAIAGTEIAA